VFLNFHTPDGGFADNLRARNRGEKGGFDSVDAEPGSGKAPTEAVFWRLGEGERLETNNRVATIKTGREQLALIEFELRTGFEGPDPHSHDDHVDSFYVLDGEVDFLVGDEWMRLPAGSFVAAPMGVTHTFGNRDGQHARLLNIHAPSTGFHDRLRDMT
jgi:quercetin dioxygenase-like cupin family protein